MSDKLPLMKMRRKSNKSCWFILGKRAIVIGGSIAGMLAARALSEFFEEVVIIEADDACNGKNPRKKVPQGHHSHVLLESGQRALNRLFPEFINELIQDGSVVTDFINDLEWFHFGQWKKRFSSGIRGVQQTRPFLEYHIQRRIKDYRNINFRHNCLAVGIILSSDRRLVQGVKIQNGSSQEELLADLVIDASGYGSKIMTWLSIEPDQDNAEAVEIELFYATRFYKSDDAREWKNLMISAKLPEQPYAGVVLSFEDNKFGVTLGGYLKQPPKTEEDFLSIAQALPQPHIFRFIQNATPISDLKIYRIPSQVRKRLDKVKNIPGRLLLAGDAFCRFDPLYGQGMAVAALEAELLLNELGRIKRQPAALNDFHKNYYKQLIKITNDPWDMATNEALRHPDISGSRPLGTGIKQWLTRKIFHASAHQEHIYLLLAQVMNLTQPSSVFFRPSVLRNIFM